MHTEVGPAGQVARFMHGLDHQWRETLQSVFTPEMQTLGTVRGDPPHQVDPISTLCHILYEHFGRIGDSQIVELAQKRTAFAKRPDETFEMTVIRFEDLRRKCREATGEQLNWTLEASDLLNVMKIDGRDRIDALRPFGGRPPSTAMQYEELKLNLRFTIQERQRKHPGTQDQRRSSVQHYAMGSADDRDDWDNGNSASYYRMDEDDNEFDQDPGYAAGSND